MPKQETEICLLFIRIGEDEEDDLVDQERDPIRKQSKLEIETHFQIIMKIRRAEGFENAKS
ncbi:hypothetical protein IGI04_039693 [Brassica rapa subsp. trilocularis]|uniref:Uncharacterized protein n=1 Tax=Brassica rapa subsp. trilocularis TaxID=1813537 RepID=A0ABQ7KKL0_BRACM|nr:hypothetical protein IGI04_039693 [Brassica rapa subsp. trilocularis]